MRSFKAWLFLLLLPFSVVAQLTEINGTAPEWSGFTVVVSRYENPISGEKVFLASDTVDANGAFNLSFDMDETSQVWLRVNRFSAPLFVESEGKYSIEISASREIALIPTWRPGSFEYFFTELDSTDINAEIIEFDRSYYDFFTQNARLIGNPALRKKVRVFESDQEINEGQFLTDYVTYSVAEMKLTAGFPKNELYNAYFKDAELKLSNPSFYSFFNVFYNDYFNRFDASFDGESISNLLSKGLTYENLDSLLLKDDFLQREDLRQWVVLKSIKETIYLKTYSGDRLVELLKTAEMKAQSNSIETAARKIRTDYERSVSANLHELCPKIKELELSEKPALVVVSQAKSNEWKREASFVTSLFEDYGEYFQVVELSLSGGQGDELWPILLLELPEGLLNDLDIYQLPWYGWMEPDGNLTKDIKKPSEGLEKRLYSIRAKAKEKEKIKVGQ